MKIVFLGTNGWYSTETGLTPCTLIDANEGYIILDAGEGIYKLDKYITDEKKSIYLFLSHYHLEHIHGFHILDKFNFKQGLNIIGKIGTKKIANLIINSPFTEKLENLPYDVNIIEVEEGEHETPLKFSCAVLPHKDPSMGYRFELEGKVITYCTDTGRSEKAIELAKNADIFISECALRPGQPPTEGWPHMNPEEAAKEAKEANVKKLILMHFDAELYTTLEQRKEAEKVAKNIFENTIAAMDDMEIEI